MDRKHTQRVELHCHSVYSQEDGVSTVKDIIDFAVNEGMPAVAITDHASVAGYGEAAYYASQHENFKMIYGMEAFAVNDLEPSVTGDEKYIMESPSFHVSFIVLNDVGKENLFGLMSIAEDKYKAFKPRIPWSEIQKHREGLLVGSACEVGELYLAVMDEEPDAVLEEIASKYDYIEIQPAENKLYCVDDDETSYEEGLAYIQAFDKKVIALGEKLGKIIVATSDAHFVTKEEAVVRSVLQRYVGYANDEQLDIHFRTTEEMLEQFSYLGEEMAWEIVVENTNKIAEMTENIQVIYKTGEHYPVLDDAYLRLKEICEDKLHDLYGEEIDRDILDQLGWELHSMMESGSDSIMLLAKELVEESGLTANEFGYRGSLGGSLVAYLCGVTCINPFESKMPLYPEFLIGLEGDKFLDIDLNFPREVRSEVWESCNDLEEIGAAFHAGVIATISSDEAHEAIDKYEDFHGLCFENEKREWIAERLTNVVKKHGMSAGAMVLVPEDYDVSEFSPLTRLTGKDYGITEISHHYLENLYCFDILTNKHINILYKLIKKTGIDVEDISLDDAEVGRLLGGNNHEMAAFGIPEFDTEYARDAANELGVESFTDVVQLICLMHGTYVWEENAETLIHQDGFTKDSVLASREDIFDCLKALGFSREEAFKIAEFVRKGKARLQDLKWQEYKKMIEDAGAPEWFTWSCERIRYMFPRAHAYIYALHVWRIAWFKLHYPKEFYDAYFDELGSEGLKQILAQGRTLFESYKVGYLDAMADGFYNKQGFNVRKEELFVAEEMLALVCVK